MLSSDEKVRIVLKLDNFRDIANVRFVNNEYKIYTQIEKCKAGGKRLNDLLCSEYIEKRSKYHLIKTYEMGKIWHFKTLMSDSRFELTNDLLLWAVYQKNIEILEFLLNFERNGKKLDATYGDDWCIRCACGNGFVEGVRSLLSWEGEDGKRVNPAVYDNACLEIACRHDYAEIVGVLLNDPRVEFNNKHLKLAFDNNNFEVLAILLVNKLI